MQQSRRRAAVGIAVVAVLVVVLAGWFWGRPWWQARSLTEALRDIPGVASVASAPDGELLSEKHPYVLRFADDVTADQLKSGLEAVDDALDDHQIGGDRAGVRMRVNGFVLVPTESSPVPDEVLEAIVALREVDGLTGVDARDGGLTAAVDTDRDLTPVGIQVLKTLQDAGVDGLWDTHIDLEIKDGGPKVWMDLADIPGSLRLLRQIDSAAAAAHVSVSPRSTNAASIQLLGGADGDGPRCTADLEIADDADFRSAARTLTLEGPDCIRLSTGPESKRPFDLGLFGPVAGVDRALELREEMRRLGGDVSRTDTAFGSVDVTVADAGALDALRRLTLDESRWPAPRRAAVTVLWSSGLWTVVDQPASVLQESGPLLVDISRRGFLAYVGVDRDQKQTIGISDDTEGAPDLTTDEGRQNLVKALRESRFEGRRSFEVSVDGDPYALSFMSTSTGKATGVHEPTQSDGTWAYELIDTWNATGAR